MYFYRRNTTNSTIGWTTNGILLWCKLKSSTSEFLYSSAVFANAHSYYFFSLFSVHQLYFCHVICPLLWFFRTIMLLVLAWFNCVLFFKGWEDASEGRQSCVRLSGESILDCPQASSKWLAEAASIQLLWRHYDEDTVSFLICVYSHKHTVLWMSWIVILTLIQRR